MKFLLTFLFIFSCSKALAPKALKIETLEPSYKKNFFEWKKSFIKRCDSKDIFFARYKSEPGLDLDLLKSEFKDFPILTTEGGVGLIRGVVGHEYKILSGFRDLKSKNEFSSSGVWENNECKVLLNEKIVADIHLVRAADLVLLNFSTKQEKLDIDYLSDNKAYFEDYQHVFSKMISRFFLSSTESKLALEIQNMLGVNKQNFHKIFSITQPNQEDKVFFKLGSHHFWHALGESRHLFSQKEMKRLLSGELLEGTFLIKFKSKSFYFKMNLRAVSHYNWLSLEVSLKDKRNIVLDKQNCLRSRFDSLNTFFKNEVPTFSEVRSGCPSFRVGKDHVDLADIFLKVISKQNLLQNFVSDWNEKLEVFLKKGFEQGESVKKIFGLTNDFEKRIYTLEKMRKTVSYELYGFNQGLFYELCLRWFTLNFEYNDYKYLGNGDLLKLVEFYKKSIVEGSWKQVHLDKLIRDNFSSPEMLFKILKIDQF